MYKPNYIFAIFATVLLVAAAVQPVIARPAETSLHRDSKPELSSLSPATASALSALGEMRAVANQQQKNGMDVAALQNATPVANRIDTDGDGLYDPVEAVLGTDVNDTDTDFDRLSDYDELFLYSTDPLKPDSNDDGLPDYFEVHNVSLDVDGDGFSNAWDFDNDGDGIIDSEDFDSFTTFEEHVYLAYDPDADTDEFAEKLNAPLNYTYLHIVSLDELLLNHVEAPYIVLVGRTDAANGTVGALVHELLNESGEVLTNMLESDSYRLVVRYGVWNSTQTIVILSHPYPSDHWRVQNLLKSRRVTIGPDTATVTFVAPQQFFEIDTIDTLKETDSIVAAALEEPVTLSVRLSRYNSSTVPFALTEGLTGGDEALGRYLEIAVNETVQNETVRNLTGATVTMYYTAADLDRTGDGDADDEADIDEGTLKMYWYDETQGHWLQLSTGMPWVLGLGVNTTISNSTGTATRAMSGRMYCISVRTGWRGKLKHRLPLQDGMAGMSSREIRMRMAGVI